MRRVLLWILLLASPCLAQYQQKPMLGESVDWSYQINRGLVGCWPMNEGGGAILCNSVVPRMPGLIYNAAWKPGRDGYCLVGSGTNEYIEVQNSADAPSLQFGSSTDFSVEVLFRYTAAVSDCRLVECQNATGDGYKGWALRFGSYGDVVLSLVGASGSAEVATTSDMYWGQAPQWVHIVCVCHRAGNGLIYTNGVQQASADISGVGNINASGMPITFGRFSNYADGYLNGSLSLVSIWSRALSPYEVVTLYHDQYAGIQQDTMMMYATTISAGGGSTVPVLKHHYDQMRAGIVPLAIPAFVILSMAYAMRGRSQ